MQDQKSWFSLEPNFPFQPTVKYWFALMWQNWYIHLFLLSIVIILAGICNWWGGNWYLIVVGGLMMLAIIWGGFVNTYKAQKTK